MTEASDMTADAGYPHKGTKIKFAIELTRREATMATIISLGFNTNSRGLCNNMAACHKKAEAINEAETSISLLT